jgi:S-DNA-T family DNA segregation ATPase FtsK/SpoIIIE
MSASKTAGRRLFESLVLLVAALVSVVGGALRLVGWILVALSRVLQGGAQERGQAAVQAPAAPVAARPVLALAPPAAPVEAARPVLTLVPRPAAPVALGQVAQAAPAVRRPAPRRAFRLPSVDLLAQGKGEDAAVDQDKLQAAAGTLVKTLAQYGVQGKVDGILTGPTVTTYELAPNAGTKVSKVVGLENDLALALGRKVRILAPIPGKNRIGFELPNDKQAKVTLRELIEDDRFEAFEASLPVVLGRDTVGNPVYADLASMPHVIVAGATGAGKSVGLNVMLTSLLYRKGPSDLRLLMIDPKVVELASFNRMPHMLLPVVTDMKQAARALHWAVSEMERRYQLLADAGTKSIASYNAWVERVGRGEAQAPSGSTPEKLPSIVIVVDEFADLMAQQGKDKEVENVVARLAQKARAAGMHLILATQRPSVDVITGVIKANFPTRIAFRVSAKVDSGIILGEGGAEQLLGKGDMLVKLNGESDTKRVQCPWVSEEEVQRVTDFLRAQGEPVYDESILTVREDERPAVVSNGRRDRRVA